MRSDPRFLEAWVNRRDHRVFGRRLHPLCLLDLVALDAIDSPFAAVEPASATAADFLLAVHILSTPPPATLEIDPDALQAGPALRFAAWRYRHRLPEQNERLRAYFDDYFSTLEMWRDDSSGKAINAPWILAKVTYLLRHSHLDERRIWTAPVGQILCYSAAIEEQVSDSQVVTDQERQLMQQLRAQASQLAAELQGTSAAEHAATGSSA